MSKNTLSTIVEIILAYYPLGGSVSLHSIYDSRNYISLLPIIIHPKYEVESTIVEIILAYYQYSPRHEQSFIYDSRNYISLLPFINKHNNYVSTIVEIILAYYLLFFAKVRIIL